MIFTQILDFLISVQLFFYLYCCMKTNLHKMAQRTIRHYIRKDDTVVVAPLNWGLGHATRCIPLIHYLKNRGNKIIIASDGEALELLKKEFPELPSESLPGYGIKYYTRNMLFNLLFSFPGLLTGLFREKSAFEKITLKYGAHVVLSDNRLAAFSKTTMNIYLTHQINIVFTNKWLRNLAGRFHQYYIRKFDTCWIPDERGKNNISGSMGYPTGIRDFHYIGHMTRIHKTKAESKKDICVMISGPEPQKSILSDALARELFKHTEYRIVWITSGTKKALPYPIPEHIEIHTMADSGLTAKALNESRLLISRSGYSTIMDIMQLPIKAILIPTPGQPEQEYLAASLRQNERFNTLRQSEIHKLKSMIESVLQDFNTTI
jgi:UDP-N-acetylglucosamine:LPS N-acetylglucosamine transferase